MLHNGVDSKLQTTIDETDGAKVTPVNNSLCFWVKRIEVKLFAREIIPKDITEMCSVRIRSHFWPELFVSKQLL